MSRYCPSYARKRAPSVGESGSRENDNAKRFAGTVAAVDDAILAATLADVAAELRGLGLDPKMVAARMRAKIEAAVRCPKRLRYEQLGGSAVMDQDDIRATEALWNALDYILQALTALAETPAQLAQMQAMAKSRVDQFVTAGAKGE